MDEENPRTAVQEQQGGDAQCTSHTDSLLATQPVPTLATSDGAAGGLLHGDAEIEAGGSDEDGEFSATDFDADSIDDDHSDSTSLRSSILEHSYVNGRRYHRYRHGRYPIPNDEAEQNREDMLHTMMMESTDGRLFYAPLGPNPQKVIDLGTGTGLWAIEFGDRYPSAEITGLDLSPIQPTWVPPNVKFLVDDVEAEWLNGDDFDLVHLRNMIPILKSPVNLLKQAYEHIRPGGWVELQDVDGVVHTDDNSVPKDWPLKRLTDLLVEAFAQFGTNANAAESGREYLEEAGFVNIQHNHIKLPYGTWPKDKNVARLMRLVGMYYRTACEDFLPAVGAMHFPRMGWEKAEMEVFFAQVRQSMRDPKVHAYGKMHFWSGQKPLGA
ncbi:methyltransferase domain-containing protein [Beauveria brongniartii RCEF 3172]|uniref:Methyltransferase domain-containing protein n=1 Tax=Beauveria brongniartii RCEF 3172 TaxID=1081107 RepID=A0A167EI29_9HYPO|nr:methyltransferase domain-containing protein [Beauveria brongniartii RCEF 3172]